MADKDDVLDLFNDAVGEGLEQDASQIMVANLDAIALAGAQGTEVGEIPTDEVTLVAMIHDGSGSMINERDVVVQSYRELLEALKGSKQAESILISDWIFNTTKELVHGFIPVAQAPDLDSVYSPGGGTALYDTALAALTGIVAYRQQLENNGVRTKCVVVVFSDGDDNSSAVTNIEVQKVAKALLDQEIYVLAYVGFSDYGVLNKSEAKQLADEIGFKDVIAAGTGPSEIRRIFQQVSASIIRASQAVVSSGGFFNNP